MNINIKMTGGITLTPAISEYINKRLEKVSKLLELDSVAQCNIELGRTTGHHNKGDIFRAEIHIVGSHKNIYASSEQSDLYAAIDVARDDVARKLTCSKEKYTARVRRGGARVKAMMKGLWPWK